MNLILIRTGIVVRLEIEDPKSVEMRVHAHVHCVVVNIVRVFLTGIAIILRFETVVAACFCQSRYYQNQNQANYDIPQCHESMNHQSFDICLNLPDFNVQIMIQLISLNIANHYSQKMEENLIKLYFANFYPAFRPLQFYAQNICWHFLKIIIILDNIKQYLLRKMKQSIIISKNLLQFDNTLNSIKRRNRSNTRQKVRIAKGLPKDFFRAIKTEEAFQFQCNDGLKTPAFRNQKSVQAKYKPFFPNKRQVSLQVYERPNTLPLRKQFPTRLYLSREQTHRQSTISRQKPNSYRNYQQKRYLGMKSISSQRQQIKFKTKLNIDIICTDVSEDLKQNKIRKNISKFFAQQIEKPKNPKPKQGKLPPLPI